MPRVKRRGPSHREQWRHELDVFQELALVIGPVGDGFDSEDDARAAWELHGERIMAEQPPGSRPAAWWQFEAGEPRPRHTDRELPWGWDAESVRLAEMGELTEPEFEALAREARRVQYPHPRRWGDARLDAFLTELRSLCQNDTGT